MTFVLRTTHALLISASIILCACSNQLDIQQLVLAEGETEGRGICATLTDDGTTLSGGSAAALDSDDDYRQYFEMGGGRATFSFFIRLSEPGDPANQSGGPASGMNPGALALEFSINQDRFGRGARLHHFETRDGVEHAVYTWAEDCKETIRSPPQWVLDKVAAP